jgi:hypothetical protein
MPPNGATSPENDTLVEAGDGAGLSGENLVARKARIALISNHATVVLAGLVPAIHVF